MINIILESGKILEINANGIVWEKDKKATLKMNGEIVGFINTDNIIGIVHPTVTEMESEVE